MAAMAFICAPKDNRSMNINEHSSLDANFAVKLHVHAVCKARPLWIHPGIHFTPGGYFILSSEIPGV